MRESLARCRIGRPAVRRLVVAAPHLASAVIREAREEIGVRLTLDEPRMIATVHHRNTAGLARVGLLFTVPFDPHRHGADSQQFVAVLKSGEVPGRGPR